MALTILSTFQVGKNLKGYGEFQPERLCGYYPTPMEWHCQFWKYYPTLIEYHCKFLQYLAGLLLMSFIRKLS